MRREIGLPTWENDDEAVSAITSDYTGKIALESCRKRRNGGMHKKYGGECFQTVRTQIGRDASKYAEV